VEATRELIGDAEASCRARRPDTAPSTDLAADLPPSSPSKARYLVKRLRAAVPGANIIVGRWAPPSLGDGQGSRLSLYRLPRDASEAIAATIVSGSTGFGR
jgi:hypothetical protein